MGETISTSQPKNSQLLTFQKKVRCFTWVILAVSVSSLASCGSQTGIVTLSTLDNGKTVQVHIGDQVMIQLNENPSTGYAWTVDQTDSTVLSLQGSDYTPTPGGLVGSGGTHVFIFVAKMPGIVHLRFKLWRSFEGDSSIIQRYNVTIQVLS